MRRLHQTSVCLLATAVLLSACSSDESTSAQPADAAIDLDAGTYSDTSTLPDHHAPPQDAMPDHQPQDAAPDSLSDATSADTGPSPTSTCDPLPSAPANAIHVAPSDVGSLQQTIAQAKDGDTFLFAKGTYHLNGKYLWIKAPNVTLRSASGNPGDVILDGAYQTTEIVTVAASHVTIAELTIMHPKTHAIHVTGGEGSDTVGTRIYRVHIQDPGQQAIKINPNTAKHFADQGEVACSTILMTDAGRPHVDHNSTPCYTGGIDAHQARDWEIRDNHIEGFWCGKGLAEHAVHLWRGCRDTVVERNELFNNARGVGFGLSQSGSARKYSDTPCPSVAAGTYVGHYGGVVRNNFIYANSQALLSSDSGFDTGIMLWSACGATVANNTIISTGENFSSVEWRFAGSQGIKVLNNLANHPLRERSGAKATQTTNIDNAPDALFADAQHGNLHLKASASAAIDKATPTNLVKDDIDGQARGTKPDIGADEVK